MRTFTWTRAGAVAAIAAAVLAGGCTQEDRPGQPAPAPSSGVAAEPVTVAVADPSGDMFTGPQGNPAPAPQQRHSDMRRVVIASGVRSIQVRVQFDELARTGLMSQLNVYLRTNTGARRIVRHFLGEISPRSWKGDMEFMRPSGESVDCAVTHAVDYRANDIRLDIPRACVGEPRWVQARAVSVFGDNRTRFYRDKSQTDHVGTNVWTQQIGS